MIHEEASSYFMPFVPCLQIQWSLASSNLRPVSFPDLSVTLFHSFHPARLLLPRRWSGECPPCAPAFLSAVQSKLFALNDLWRFLNDFLGFGEDELDVTGVGHVGVYLHKCMDEESASDS